MANYKIGVVGAGNMGSGIAQKMAQEGLQVVLADVNLEAAKRGLGIIDKVMQQGVARKIFTQSKIDETLSRIKVTEDYNDLADCDLVLEAVYEDVDVKGQLFKKLDKICKPDTIFATNTSALSISKIAAYTDRPDRFVGMHYFFHPAKNKLLEVISTGESSEESFKKAVQIGKLHGKIVVMAKDTPGFIVNRFFVPWLCEAVRILNDGIANIPTIDQAAKDAFHIGMGPFELMNVTGIPIAVHSAEALAEVLGKFYLPPEMLVKQMESKNLFDLTGPVDESKFEAVSERLFAVALGVACEAYGQGVATIDDFDRGAKLGLRWKYGPFEMINRYGVERTYEAAKKLSKINPAFVVPKVLADQAKSGKLFEFTLVKLDVVDDIAYITIDRPEAMNALNADVIDQLEKKFNEAEANPQVKTIAFQGSGKAFIAGADIKFFVDNIVSNNINASVEFTEKGHDLFLRFENSKKLTIAVVDGLSLGGGSELALSCQAIVATKNGSFGFPESGIGIYPGYGGMIRTARQMGTELAKYYVFTGRTLKAAEAYELGIVTKMAEVGMVDEAIKEVAANGKPDKYRARTIPASYNDKMTICKGANVAKLLAGQPVDGVDKEFAEKTAKIIAAKAPLALKTINELMDAQKSVSIPEAIKLELGRLVEIFSTEDALAGLQSPGKAAPQYKGR